MENEPKSTPKVAVIFGPKFEEEKRKALKFIARKIKGVK